MVLTEALLLPELREQLQHARGGYVSWQQQIVAPDLKIACGFPLWHPEQQVSGAVVIQRDDTPNVDGSIHVTARSLMLPLGGIVVRNTAHDMDHFHTGAFRSIHIKNGSDTELDITLADCREQAWRLDVPSQKAERIAIHMLDVAQRGYLLDLNRRPARSN